MFAALCETEKVDCVHRVKVGLNAFCHNWNTQPILPWRRLHPQERGGMFELGALCLVQQPGSYWDRSSAFVTCGG